MPLGKLLFSDIGIQVLSRLVEAVCRVGFCVRRS
jgi:hypothetical protein